MTPPDYDDCDGDLSLSLQYSDDTSHHISHPGHLGLGWCLEHLVLKGSSSASPRQPVFGQLQLCLHGRGVIKLNPGSDDGLALSLSSLSVFSFLSQSYLQLS